MAKVSTHPLVLLTLEHIPRQKIIEEGGKNDQDESIF